MRSDRLLLLLAAPLSWILIFFVRRYVSARGILDVPSGRSSHSIPTPRGGGLGIVAVTIAFTLIAAQAKWIQWPVVFVLAGGGSVVALVGWLEDKGGFSPSWRLAVHLAAAVWAVWWLGAFRGLNFAITGSLAYPIAMILSILALTWAVSAYNFMDGIDALAVSGAIWVGLVGGWFAWTSGNDDVAFLSLLIAAASLGFLPWNLPRARLFMGDVGSGFLGYALAVIALFSDGAGALPAEGWLVLLGVFAFDSTVTLCRRLIRREKWNVTHRESGYQRAALRVGRHGPVTLFIVGISIVLAGLCWIAWQTPRLWGPIMFVSLLLLIFLYWQLEKWAPVVRN